MRLAGLCLLIATPAVADVETREDALGNAELVPLTAKQIGWRYRVDLAAAGLAQYDGKDRQGGGILTANAHVALTTRAACDLFGMGGQLTGRSQERLLSATHRASLCPIGGNGHLLIDHRLDWDVTPRILGVPRLRPGPSRRETVGIEIVGSTKPYDAEDDPDDPTTVDWIEGGRARMETSVGWTAHRAPIDMDVLTYLEAVMRTFRHDYDDGEPLTFEVLQIRGEALVTFDDLTDSIMVGGVTGNVARVEGYRAGVFRLGGRAGGRLGAISHVGVGEAKMNLVNLAEGAVSADVGPLRVAAERSSSPTWDGRLVVDNRGSMVLRGTVGKLRGSLELAIAYTQLFSADVYRKGVTGGATLEAEYELGRYFSVRARSETGRTLYTQAMVLDEPEWASETMLLVAAHAHRGIKR